MKLTCNECKNDVDLTLNSDLAVGDMVECQMCGITLEIMTIDEDTVKAEIAEEGK